MKIRLFDNPETQAHLMPFTLTRSIGEIRLGIGTIREKWEWISGEKVTIISNSGSNSIEGDKLDEYLFLDSAVVPDDYLFQMINNLPSNHSLTSKGRIIGVRSNTYDQLSWLAFTSKEVDQIQYIDRLWKINQLNGEEIKKDFFRISKNKASLPISDSFTKVYNPHQVFIEEGVSVRASVINADTGPVYLGKNSQVMEGSIIRGPFALGEGSIVGMGTIIRGDTTVGPFSRVGGEINNTVFFSHSNKAHHGFLGNAVIGSWCNLGAGTTASNLKNNFKNVQLWDGYSKTYENTGLQFCGLMMGDFATSAINTSFNTGTWVGPGARIIGAEFPPAFIPPFVQSSVVGFKKIPLREVLNSTARFYALKKTPFTNEDKLLIEVAFNRSAELRNLELLKSRK